MAESESDQSADVYMQLQSKNQEWNAEQSTFEN